MNATTVSPNGAGEQARPKRTWSRRPKAKTAADPMEETAVELVRTGRRIGTLRQAADVESGKFRELAKEIQKFIETIAGD